MNESQWSMFGYSRNSCLRLKKSEVNELLAIIQNCIKKEW